MSYDTTNVDGAKDLIDGDEPCKVIDVRTVDEFRAGHQPGAYNVPFAFFTTSGLAVNEEFVPAMKRAFQPDEHLLMVCKQGVRSMHACDFLAKEGYSKLVNLDGGFHGSPTAAGWASSGYAVTTEAEPGRTWEELRQG